MGTRFPTAQGSSGLYIARNGGRIAFGSSEVQAEENVLSSPWGVYFNGDQWNALEQLFKENKNF